MARTTWLGSAGLAVAAGVVGFSAALLLADPSDKSKTMPGGAKMEPPAMDPMAMMAEFIKLAEPVEQHATLARLVGTHEANVKTWMDPSAPAMESKGTMTCKAAHGGRFVIGEYTGDFMGQAFTGTAIWGFNKVEQRFEGVWMDSMSTPMMVSHGQISADGNTITSTGEFKMPMPGMDKPMTVKQREVMTFIDEKTCKMEMYHASDMAPGEHKVMEITYTRKN